MKKVKLLMLPLVLLTLITTKPAKVYADEVVAEEKAQEEFKLSEYLNVNVVANIVSWLMSSGVLTFALSVLVKAKKYSSLSTDELVEKFKGLVGDFIKENMNDLTKDELDKINNTIKGLTNAQETIMKVLVLMQDNTAKGKVALMEYLGSKTESKEVVEAVEQIVDELKEQEAVCEVVKEKVANEYKDIF